MALSAAQIEHYQTYGWVSPIDIMSPAEALELGARLEQAEADYPEHLHAEHRNNAHLILPFLADLAKHHKVVDAVTSLVGPNLTLWSSVLFIKEANTGSFVSWHQDATYMGLAPDEFVTAWIALSPSTAESGCVAVLPGTHRTGMVDHVDLYGEDNILTRGQQVVEVDETLAVNLELRPGQMSLHHPWLVHGSRPNKASYRRIGVAYQSYLSPKVMPRRGEHHVMHIAGAPADTVFVEASPPDGMCTPAGIETRSRANQALADVLYKGAATRRPL